MYYLILIVAVCSAVMGAVVVFFVLRAKHATLIQINKHAEQQIDELSCKLSLSETEKSSLGSAMNVLQVELAQLQKEQSLILQQKDDLKADFGSEKMRVSHLQSELSQSKQENAAYKSRLESATKEIALLNEQMANREKEQKKLFDQQLDMVREQMQNATQEILKQREASLQSSNKEQLSVVVNPLKEQIESMRKQVADTIKTSTENRTSIEKAIETLLLRTQEIGNDANNLAKALTNESKVQGNWGEIILESLLERSGLEENKHYNKQVAMRDPAGNVLHNEQTGKRMIPDVIVHYPDGKDVIIDAKVSLTAYLDYCNAEDDEQRKQALSRHVASVRSHVKELHQKDYTSYIQAPRQALRYMIMFVPNESAMQLALQHDTKLWQEAFESGICITSEQNLIILLRMIQLAWVQVQQAQNQKEVFDQARKILDRIAQFIEHFNDVQKKLADAQAAWDNASKKLTTGQQSIIKAANDMQKLGAKTSANKSLPYDISDQTNWL